MAFSASSRVGLLMGKFRLRAQAFQPCGQKGLIFYGRSAHTLALWAADAQ
jgi:hypothetical protein